MFNKSIILGAALAGLAFSAPAFAEGGAGGDAAKGEKVFKKCMSCHMVGEGAKVKVGPPLTGLIGRQAGTWEGMKYGDDLVAAGTAGLVWTEDEVFEYLAHPRNYLRKKLDNKKAKSKMAYRLKKDDDRRDVIAYIMSVK